MTSGLTLRLDTTRRSGCGQRVVGRRALVGAANGGVRPHGTVIALADHVTLNASVSVLDQCGRWLVAGLTETRDVPLVRHLDVKFDAGIRSGRRAP